MSPDGSKFALLTAGSGSETLLQVADPQTGQTLNLTKSDGRPQSLRWCNFAGSARLVCEHSGDEVFEGKIVGFSALFAISTDGRTLKPLRPKSSFASESLRQDDGAVIDWLPGENGTVLMARRYVADANTTGSLLGRSKRGLGVDRIDLNTLKITSVEQPREGASGYMTDGRGAVRLMYTPQKVGADGMLSGLTQITYRTRAGPNWLELGTYNGVTGEGWYPLAIDADVDAVYALKRLNGRDALYQVKLDGSRAATLIGSDAGVDIDGVVRLGPGQRVIGYTYADDRRRTVYFDQELLKLQRGLQKALPAQPQISFQGATSDGQKLLIFASGDTHPGTFYRFDRTTKQLAEVAQVRPQLEGRQLSPMKPITVTASDGAKIPAYLTLPVGSAGKNLPAVVLPHGGPSSRDEWGFDWLPQFLAARGYAVIQPNYRGSAGYGDDWMSENGFKGWRTSISDVTAAAHYLTAQGIADPNKLAIVGWSYGGYAALQSAVVEPGLYKSVVAIAPVTDLGRLKDDSEGFTNAKLVASFVGTGPHLEQGSPARNAAAIKVPVLLVHGDRDGNVAISQSERMAAALKSAGKPVEMMRFANLDHQLDDSAARTQMLTRIATFLDQSISK